MEEYNSKKEEGFEVMSATLVEPQVVPRISFPVPANAKIPDAVSLQCAYTLFKTFNQLFSDLILSIQDIKNNQSFFRDVTYNRDSFPCPLSDVRPGQFGRGRIAQRLSTHAVARHRNGFRHTSQDNIPSRVRRVASAPTNHSADDVCADFPNGTKRRILILSRRSSE